MTTDPSDVLSRTQVLEYFNSGDYPTTEQLSSFGAAVGYSIFVDTVTKSSTTMNIGMFGTDDDFYFFFMQFSTADTNILTGGFQMWF